MYALYRIITMILVQFLFSVLPSHAKSVCYGNVLRILPGALAPRADEGRGKLRKGMGRSKHPVIHAYPNGATHHQSCDGTKEADLGN